MKLEKLIKEFELIILYLHFTLGLSLDSSGTVCTDDRVGSCFLDNRQGICSKEVCSISLSILSQS